MVDRRKEEGLNEKEQTPGKKGCEGRAVGRPEREKNGGGLINDFFTYRG